MNIEEVQLYSNDIAATAAFYEHTLQLPVSHNNDGSIRITAGQSALHFVQGNDRQQPVYHFAFNIPQNQLADAIDWAKGKVQLLPVASGDHIVADFERWNAHAVYFFDNNGNILEWIARHDLPNASAEPFSGKAVHCISEIGIATDHVAAFADELMHTYQVPVFSRQPRLEQFIALGDDNGLFIISATGRHWFPTHIPAARFPAAIRFNDGTGTKELVVRP